MTSNKSLIVVILVVAAIILGFVVTKSNEVSILPGVGTQELSSPAKEESPDSSAPITAIAEVQPELQVSGSAPNLFSDALVEASPEDVEWADDLYNNAKAKLTAQRYRFVQIDYELLHRQLKQSPIFMAVAIGRSPPPVYDDSPPTFGLTLFNDRRLELLVTDVRLSGSPGEQHIVFLGKIVSGGDGKFKLSTFEGQNTLRGQIDTPDTHTRIDTRNGSSVTAVADIERRRIEEENIPID